MALVHSPSNYRSFESRTARSRFVGSVLVAGLLLVSAACRGPALARLPDRSAGQSHNPYTEPLAVPLAEVLAHSQADLNHGRADSAATRLAAWLDAAPRSIRLHCLYQDAALAAGGDTEAAMRHYYMNLRDDGTSPHHPFLLARIAPHEVACKEALERALRRDPGFHPACIEMARMRRKISQPAIALRSLQRAVELQPACTVARREIAATYLDLQQWRAAEKHLRIYVQACADDYDARATLVWLMVHKTDKAAAATSLVEELLRERPADDDRWLDRAAIHWQAGEFEAATNCYREVLRRRPDHALAALNLADVYFTWGERDGQVRSECWQRARLAYRYFLSLGMPEDGLLAFHRFGPVPVRLQKIDAAIGAAAAASRASVVSDL